MNKTILIAFTALTLFAAAAFAGQNSDARAALVFPGASGGSAEMMKDDYLEVRIDLSNMEAVNAVHIDLKYDTKGLAFAGWEDGDLYSDPLVLGPFDRTEKGVVDVTVATLNGARRVTEAAAGTVRFRVLDPRRTDVAISTFESSDANWEIDTQIDLSRGIGAVPTSIRLLGNVPNPFNPTTQIRFELPRATHVSLKVIDVSGRLVKRLIAGTESAGAREVMWDGRNDSDQAVASGVYFMHLEAGGESQMKKMTLIR